MESATLHDVPPLMKSATPPPLTCHSLPLLAVVYGDGWRQRSTLAFGAKSLVPFSLALPCQQKKQNFTFNAAESLPLLLCNDISIQYPEVQAPIYHKWTVIKSSAPAGQRKLLIRFFSNNEASDPWNSTSPFLFAWKGYIISPTITRHGLFMTDNCCSSVKGTKYAT